MKILEEGQMAPDFTVPSDKGGMESLNAHRGKPVILYFYPKDDTPGCTQQACDFRDTIKDFGKLGAVVLGVSKDSLKKHEKFRDKFELNFPLLSDEDGALCEAYGVWVEKSMYGKKYMGIDRSTFLIDSNGKIHRIWRKVKVPGHVEDVRQALAALLKKAA